jgi:hypothetical protein
MLINKSRVFAASLSILWTTPVFAQPAIAESNWWIAGQMGQKPNRIVVMIDIGNTKPDEVRSDDKGPFIAMPVFIVYEAATSPDYSRLTLRNYCDKQKTDVVDVNSYWRNDVNEPGIAALRFKPSDEGTKLLFQLACGDAAATLASGHFEPMDVEYRNQWYPGSYPWKKLWLDGKRPAYTTSDTRSQPEKDAEWAGKMAEAQRILAGGTAMATGVIDKANADTAFWEDQAIRRKSRPKSKLNPYLEGWLRKDEQYIVQNLGVPDGVYATGNSRFLTYFNGWTQRFTSTNAVTGQVVGIEEQSYVCELTMELQDNKMIDFKFKGNSCGYGEFAGH